MNDLLVDRKMVLMKVLNLCHRMNDRLVDLNSDDVLVDHCMNDRLGDRKMVVNLAANLCHRRNDRLDDLNSDDVRRDRKMVLKMDVSLELRRTDLLGDQMTGVSRVNRRSGVHPNAQLVYEHRVDLKIDLECYVRHDRSLGVMMDGMTDGNRDHHVSDRLDDQMTDANLDVMNHHVK
jgi:hypothetical protein